MALLEQVQQAAGGRNDDVDALRKGRHLGPLPHATQDDRLAQAEAGAVVAEVVVDLDGKLAGRRQHQGARRARLGPLAGFGKLLEHRQGKRGGLARSGLGDAQQVIPGQEPRDRLLLDGSGRRVASGSQRADDGLGQAERRKVVR